MSSNGEWENIKTQYITTLTSQSRIIKTKTLFTHLDNFLMENNLTFKDLSHDRDNFKAYLQNKVSKTSFTVYWSYFAQFYGWLESNYLKVESASTQTTQAPAIESKSEPQKPISKPETPLVTFDLDKWISERNYTCPDCQSQPFKDKDGLWCVICPKPKEWKEGKYGTLRPTKGAKGKINIEICQNTQAFIIKRKIKPEVQPTEKAETEEGIDLSKLPKIRKPMIHPINQVGVCENPILVRQGHDLTCVLCRKRTPQKWQACQEIQKELDTSPIAFDKFAKAMRERLIDERKAGEDPYWWWVAPKTEDMTLEEIEKELGLREPSQPRRISCSKFCSPLKIMNCEKYPSCDLNTGVSAPEEEPDLFDIAERETEPLRFREGKTITEDQPVSQELFDSIRKRYHEVCEACEEYLHQRCTNYCNEFWEGLPADMRSQALKLKRYPSEEVIALREPLRERLKEIVPEEGIEE